MNPNIEIPQPKSVNIRKIAIDIEEYDSLRKYGEKAEDLSQPAEPLQKIIASTGDYDIETTNYIMNEGYRSRTLLKK